MEYKIYFPLDIYIQEYFESPVQVSGFDWFSWGVKTSSQHCTRSKMAHTAADTEVLSMLNTRHWRLYIFALCQHNHNTLKTLELIILSTEHILYTGLHSGEEEKKEKKAQQQANQRLASDKLCDVGKTFKTVKSYSPSMVESSRPCFDQISECRAIRVFFWGFFPP